MALLAASVAAKPQAALVLPVVIVVLVHRHVRTRLSRGPRSVVSGLARVTAIGAVGAAAGLALLLPFGLGPVTGYEFYQRAADTYRLNSLFAFNAWGAFGFWKPDAGDGAITIFGVPAFDFGLAMFITACILIGIRSWSALSKRQDDGRVIVFGSVAVSLIGFTFLTRIHERYLFVPVALLAALVGFRALRASFVALSGLYLMNLVLPYLDHYKSAGRAQPGIADVLYILYGREVGGIRQRVLSVLTAAFCVFLAGWGWRALRDAGPVRPTSGTR